MGYLVLRFQLYFLSIILCGMSFCSHAALGQDSQEFIESLQTKYSQFGGVVMHARDAHTDTVFVYAVVKDGAYSYRQYDKEMYGRIYREHRDVEGEWDSIPAHFVYYDGDLKMISAAPFDPAGMYDDVSLSKPLILGEKLPVLMCVWPVIGALIERGIFEPNELGSWTLKFKDVRARIVFDQEGLIREVVWGEDGDKTVLVGRWVYSGYGEGGDPLLPTKMVQTYRSANQDAKHAINSEAHFRLKFDRNPDRVIEALRFVDTGGEYARRDFKTHDVFGPDGEFLYNQDEMAEEYLAALGKGNPKRTRWVLLVVLGLGVIGSVWALRKRAA